jgi:glucose-6-phosphate isomerase
MNRAAVDQTFAALTAHRAAYDGRTIAALFEDTDRFSRFSARQDDLILDYSKCAIDASALDLLLRLAQAANVAGQRDAMLSGAVFNNTEKRAVLHTALRGGATASDPSIARDVTATRDAFCAFAEGIRSGRIAAADGKSFTDVVNIGIGGSDLGPVMATLALAPYHDGPRLHFVSNIDGSHIADTLKKLDPARTLFIIASKTFTTIETMTNAQTARRWLVTHLGESAVGAHCAAVSTALDKVAAFGIAPDRVFGFWDWVGGRYSLWSAIGLPLAIAIGETRFNEFLAGGQAMDTHFRTTPFAQNLPVLLGLIGLWHRDVCLYPARAIIPYDQRLARFPAYLQQLDMESNGKSLDRDGQPVTRPTGPLVWGEPGSNSQHAFFQLLHQGTDTIPVEFLIATEGHEPDLQHQHAILIANCLAQSEALMRGRTPAEAEAAMLKQGRTADDAQRLAPFRSFPGNRPSVTLAYRRLDPFTLGRLIALYEHRVFVEAAVWNINAFDQWGVELGKELATALLPAVDGQSSDVPVGTAGLLAAIRALK